ncbi:MAG: UDP-N-acetylmuramoylalanine--D-glutamate ligase [Planctomycetota bacterium]
MNESRPGPAATQPTPIAGRRALVMGLGTFGGGLGAVHWLVQQGAQVTVTDLNGEERLGASLQQLAELDVELVLGQHREQEFRAADLIVANPAVPTTSPWLELGRSAGAQVTSEVELFLERVRGTVLAVTGTQGKSSTVSMTHQLLALTGKPAHLGGNIGGSLLEQLASIQTGNPVVMELSSYQLEALPRRTWPTAVTAIGVTNILADHLERHGCEEAYGAAKARILDLAGPATRILVPGTCTLLRNHIGTPEAQGRALFHGSLGEGADATAEPALRVENGRFRLKTEDLGALADLSVPGSFQANNALVALGLARIHGVPARTLRRFVSRLRGLPHRLEDLGRYGGLRVIDNGVSTTPDSTQAVLGDVERGASLLIGGKAKRLCMENLLDTARSRDLRVFAFGAAGQDLERAFDSRGLRVTKHETLDDAVVAAFATTEAGGTLLFSPACASFDAYTNFRERAESFRALLPDAETD